MNEVINLRCRHGEKNYLKLLKKLDNSESKTYALKTSTAYIQEFKDEGKITINPIGGPKIKEGERIPFTDLIVKSINFVDGYGYTITFV